jgi:hypothetical protein
MAESGKQEAAYQTVRRWLALGRSELRPIDETNAIMAKLAEFARVVTMRRRAAWI